MLPSCYYHVTLQQHVCLSCWPLVSCAPSRCSGERLHLCWSRWPSHAHMLGAVGEARYAIGWEGVALAIQHFDVLQCMGRARVCVMARSLQNFNSCVASCLVHIAFVAVGYTACIIT
jgi:hypothetical protein